MKTISAYEVIRAGPTNLQSLTKSAEVVKALRVAYSIAVKNTFYYALVTAILAIPFALCMERINVKKAAKQREGEGDGDIELGDGRHRAVDCQSADKPTQPPNENDRTS